MFFKTSDRSVVGAFGQIYLLLVVAIWEARCLHFGTLRIYSGPLKAPWMIMEVAGRTRAGLEPDVIDLIQF